MKVLLCAWVLLLWSATVFGHNFYGFKGWGSWQSSDGSKGQLTFRYEDEGWDSDYYEETRDSFVLDLEFDSGESENIFATLVFDKKFWSGGKVLDAEGNNEIGAFSCQEADAGWGQILYVCTAEFTDEEGRKITVVKSIDDEHSVRDFSGTITTADGTHLVWKTKTIRDFDGCVCRSRG